MKLKIILMITIIWKKRIISVAPPEIEWNIPPLGYGLILDPHHMYNWHVVYLTENGKNPIKYENGDLIIYKSLKMFYYFSKDNGNIEDLIKALDWENTKIYMLNFWTKKKYINLTDQFWSKNGIYWSGIVTGIINDRIWIRIEFEKNVDPRKIKLINFSTTNSESHAFKVPEIEESEFKKFCEDLEKHVYDKNSVKNTLPSLSRSIIYEKDQQSYFYIFESDNKPSNFEFTISNGVDITFSVKAWEFYGPSNIIQELFKCFDGKTLNNENVKNFLIKSLSFAKGEVSVNNRNIQYKDLTGFDTKRFKIETTFGNFLTVSWYFYVDFKKRMLKKIF